MARRAVVSPPSTSSPTAPNPPAAARGSRAPVRPHWDASCGWLAFLLPSAAGVWLAAAHPLWRSDSATLELLGAPPALQGAVSALLGHCLQLLPLGGSLGRAASLGGLALGVAGVVLYRICLALLERNGSAPRLNPAVSLCAALAAVLSVPWLAEGTITGGQAVAGALALSTLWCAGATPRTGPFVLRAGAGDENGAVPRTVLTGALLGATLLENVGAGLATAVALGVLLWQAGRVPKRRGVFVFSGSLGIVVCAALAPVLLAPALVPVKGLAPERIASLQSGLGLDRLGLDGLGPHVDPEAWVQEVGLLLLAAALFGGLWGLGQRGLRRALAPLVAVVLLDGLAGGPGADPGLVPTRTGIHLLGIGAVLCAAALGLQSLALLARRAGLAGARPAVALLMAMTVAVTWAGAEDALRVVARRNTGATECWTDEVLASLPHRSLVVVHSGPVVRRLGAAVAAGARSDVVVVPLPLLGRGNLAAELLELEPALALLVRDLSTTGRPSERALTALADARPLFVEADPSWDRRLVAHVVPGPFLARFAPHALGRSDRRVAFAAQQGTFERVATAALGTATRDAATLAVLTASAQQRKALLEVLGDDEEAAEIEVQLQRVQRAPPQTRALLAQATDPSTAKR